MAMQFIEEDGGWFHEAGHTIREPNVISEYRLRIGAKLVSISNSQLQEPDVAALHLRVKEQHKLHVISAQGFQVDNQSEDFPTVCHKFVCWLRDCSSSADSIAEMGRFMSQVNDHSQTREWLTICVSVCVDYMATLAREAGKHLSMEATLYVCRRFYVREDTYNQVMMAQISAESFELARTDEQGFGAIRASGTSVEELERYVCDGRNLDGGSICVICQDEFSDEVTLLRMPCTHVFHEECLIEWLNRSNACPICRFKILSNEIEEK